MNRRIEQLILNIYNSVFKQVFDKDAVDALSNANRTTVIQNVAKVEASDKYDEFAKKFATKLAKYGLNQQRGIWRKFYTAAKQAHYVALPPTYTAYERALLYHITSNNYEMIKSIPRRVMELMNRKYVNTLIEEVALGKHPRGYFRKMLEQHGHKNAGVIARTETAKLQTAILEQRALSLGSVAYIWLSSNDKRTRPSHKAMNGVVVFWRNDMRKPLLDNMRGNAGEFPNCRCSPQPIVDTDDLKDATYRVYDYRIDKIVKMNRKTLIEYLQRGSLD